MSFVLAYAVHYFAMHACNGILELGCVLSLSNRFRDCLQIRHVSQRLVAQAQTVDQARAHLSLLKSLVA